MKRTRKNLFPSEIGLLVKLNTGTAKPKSLHMVLVRGGKTVIREVSVDDFASLNYVMMSIAARLRLAQHKGS